MLIRVAGTLSVLLYELFLYYASFVGPFTWVYHVRYLPAPALLAVILCGGVCSTFTFLLLLVITKRFLIGRLATGQITADSKEAHRWFLAVSLICILDRSPFRAIAAENPLLAPWFYRGMGARIPPSASFGTRSMIFDPWFLQIGKNTSVGAYSVILGHIAHNQELVLGRVIIGDNVVIGGQSVIFPDVRIGHNARVGVGAVVTRGTVIPDGEVWAGIPAKPITSQRAQLN